MSERPWHRLHGVTWGVLIVFFWVMAWCQSHSIAINIYVPHGGHWCSGLGWPLSVFMSDELPPDIAEVNKICIVLALSSTGFVCEKLLRSRFTFHLSTILAVVLVVAVVLTIKRVENEIGLAILTESHMPHRPIGLSTGANWFEWYQRIPLVCSLGCTIYTAGWLAVWPIGRLLRRAYRDDQVSPIAD